MKVLFDVDNKVQKRFNVLFDSKYNYINFGNEVVKTALSFAKNYGYTKLDLIDNISNIVNLLDSVCVADMDFNQVIFIMQEIASIITRLDLD